MIHAMTQVDALAVVMLVVLALAFGCVLGIVIMIYRRGRSVDDEVHQLIEEVAEEERAVEKAGSPKHEPEREPWEREGDWWRK